MFSRHNIAITPVLDCPLRDQNYYFKTSAAPKILCSMSITFARTVSSWKPWRGHIQAIPAHFIFYIAGR